MLSHETRSNEKGYYSTLLMTYHEILITHTKPCNTKKIIPEIILRH